MFYIQYLNRVRENLRALVVVQPVALIMQKAVTLKSTKKF
jgi:hypothetical protein